MADETAMRESRWARWIGLDRAFVALALIVGNALVIIVPPFQAADEGQHFFRAWQITQGQFISRETTDTGEAGGRLPSSVNDFFQRFWPMAMHPERKTTAKYIFDAFKIPLEPGNVALVEFGNTAHYCPIGYFPQCLGIGIGRMLSLPLPMMLYFAREANLIVFTLLGYFSLRFAPAIARPVFLLLLIPTMLCLAASASADVLSDGLAILFTALVCRYYAAGEQSIGLQAFLILLAVSLPLSVQKYVYVPLLAILLLVPATNFSGYRRKAAMIMLLLAINIVAVSAWAVSTSSLDTRITVQPNVSPSRQFALLEQHPFRVVRLSWNTARDAGWYICTTYVAVIGWMDLNFPPSIVLAYFCILIFACWTAGDWPLLPSPGNTALVVLPIVIASCLGIGLLNYFYWTAVGSSHVVGLQGRYFFPLTPAVFVLACSAARRLPRPHSTPRMETRLNFAMIFISALFSASLVISIWSRFYG